MDKSIDRAKAQKLTDYSAWELLARTFHPELPFTIHRIEDVVEDEKPARRSRFAKRKAKKAKAPQEVDPTDMLFVVSPVFGACLNEQSVFVSVTDGWVEYHMRAPTKGAELHRPSRLSPNALRGMA